MAYSSAEDGDDELAANFEDLAEIYGTPPIRHVQSKKDLITGARRLRKLPIQTELPKRERGRRQRNMTKVDRQKSRLSDRAFKELDTTLQVLGIDGSSNLSSLRVTASPHAPTMPMVATPKLRGALSRGSREEMDSTLSSNLSIASSGSLTSDQRLKARGRSSSLGIEQRRSGSSPSLARAPVSRQDTLEFERQKWHAVLDNLLEGNLDQEDMKVALSLAASKAGDLKDQLTFWSTPPEANWPMREERLEWLSQALMQLKDIATGLQQHGAKFNESNHIRQYLAIIKDVVVEMEGMASMCCNAIGDGLHELKQLPQDTRRAFRAVFRAVKIIIPAAEKQRHFHQHDPEAGWEELLAKLGSSCASLVQAAIVAASDLQEALLQSHALDVSLGKDVSGHEVSERGKLLQSVWGWVQELVGLVSSCWPEQTMPLQCAWCKLLLKAAEQATRMQKGVHWCNESAAGLTRDDSSGFIDDSVGSSWATSGVWGVAGGALGPRRSDEEVTDEDLQAQAWLPACLSALLCSAGKAATAVLGCEDPDDPECATVGLGCTETGWRACQGLVDELSEALYVLALTGTWRVANLCRAPQGLACWALELLEEQACQAVVFVRDLDRSVLGRGENGLTHYEVLRKATDALVNSILRVRRLLKQKRAVDEDDGLPRPLPMVRSDSQSTMSAALTRRAMPPMATRMVRGAPEQPVSSPSALRPPLANGRHSSQMSNGSSGGTASAEGASKPSEEGPQKPRRRERSRRHRHGNGTATPPIQEDADGEAGMSEAPHECHRRSRRSRHRHDRHGRRQGRSPDTKPPSQAATDSSDCSEPTTQRSIPSALPSATGAPVDQGSQLVANAGGESEIGHPLAGARQGAGDALARGDLGPELLQELSRGLGDRNGGAQQGDFGRLSQSQGVESEVSGTHTADAYQRFIDPFAQDAVQHAPLVREPFLAAELSQPIAIFSSEPSVQSRNGSLLAPGVRPTIRFGTYSSSPTSPRVGAFSRQGSTPRGMLSSAFSGVAAPQSAFTFPIPESPAAERLASANGDSSSGRLPSGLCSAATDQRLFANGNSSSGHHLSGLSSAATDRQTLTNGDSSSGRLPSNVSSATREELAGMSTMELGGAPIHQQRRSLSDAASDWSGHPMSDPTHGYHIQHHALQRVSIEALRRQPSSDSSSETASAQGTSEAEPKSGGTSTSGQPALVLPWEGERDPFWQIKWEELKPTLVRKLGSGSFGQVFEAYFHSAPMAVKIMNLDGDVGAIAAGLLRFKQEVDLQRRLSLHPNIVRFLGACCHLPDGPIDASALYSGTSSVTLAIVMELCRLGTLFRLIGSARRVLQANLPPEVIDGTKPPRTPEEQRLKMGPGFRLFSSWTLRLELAMHAAAAVEYMHSQNVVHRDLTSYNLLVTDKFEAKVADFNLSRAMQAESVPHSGIINSPEWQAPERLSGQAYGKSSDVFSFGVIIWELTTLAWPWHEPETSLGTTSSQADVPEGVPGAPMGVPLPDTTQQARDPFFVVMHSVPRGSRLAFPPLDEVQPALPQLPQLVELAQDCWKQDQSQRPTMKRVCERLEAILKSVKQDAREKKGRRPGF